MSGTDFYTKPASHTSALINLRSAILTDTDGPHPTDLSTASSAKASPSALQCSLGILFCNPAAVSVQLFPRNSVFSPASACTLYDSDSLSAPLCHLFHLLPLSYPRQSASFEHISSSVTISLLFCQYLSVPPDLSGQPEAGLHAFL